MTTRVVVIHKIDLDEALINNHINPRYSTNKSSKSIYLADSHTWAMMQGI